MGECFARAFFHGCLGEPFSPLYFDKRFAERQPRYFGALIATTSDEVAGAEESSMQGAALKHLSAVQRARGDGHFDFFALREHDISSMMAFEEFDSTSQKRSSLPPGSPPLLRSRYHFASPRRTPRCRAASPRR